jgi:hypothetical protein
MNYKINDAGKYVADVSNANRDEILEYLIHQLNQHNALFTNLLYLLRLGCRTNLQQMTILVQKKRYENLSESPI